MFIAVIVVFQCCWTTYYSLLHDDKDMGVFRSTENNVSFASHSKEYASEKKVDLEKELEFDGSRNSRKGHILNNRSFKVGNHEDAVYSFIQKRPKYADLSSILAFFAGSMYGYLCPILLKHWETKEPDMKIFGPMSHDLEGKRMYMEYMNSSKYCICARGYEVHMPRIIEAIFSECIGYHMIHIRDNYVPSLFEVLKWEKFSVFVHERNIPSLRNLLLLISEEKYLVALHLQQHFLWHKVPVKYDLFHMILHAIWNNRLSQIRPR
uniref:Exostosin GT47 domain-containing protein n=1 Tax=Cajanus cajan TaxID=3821 RepID=A0A151TDJ7_CAJCA|nr:hypothetical protein KK1_011349 [Cajanus cajan]